MNKIVESDYQEKKFCLAGRVMKSIIKKIKNKENYLFVNV